MASHFASKQPEVKESNICNKIKMVLDALKFAETPQLQGNYNDSYWVAVAREAHKGSIGMAVASSLCLAARL